MQHSFPEAVVQRRQIGQSPIRTILGLSSARITFWKSVSTGYWLSETNIAKRHNGASKLGQFCVY